MSAVANIVLNDAQVSPVAHTFIPVGPDQNGVWWWENQLGDSPNGYARISMQLVRVGNPAPGSNNGGQVNRVKVGIHTPKLETLGTNDAGITPAPTVSYIPRASLEFLLPDRSSLQDRKDLRKYVDFLCAEAQLTAMVETLQNVY